MSFSLKPRLFLIGFLPGFLFIAGCLALKKNCDYSSMGKLLKDIILFSGTAIIVFSFIIGQVFDSVRDLIIENLLKFDLRKCKFVKENNIDWDFFYKADEKNIKKLDENFYLFYVINTNISICFFLFLLMIIFNWPFPISSNYFGFNKFGIIILIIISIIVLIGDAVAIRPHIVKITKGNLDMK